MILLGEVAIDRERLDKIRFEPIIIASTGER